MTSNIDGLEVVSSRSPLGEFGEKARCAKTRNDIEILCTTLKGLLNLGGEEGKIREADAILCSAAKRVHDSLSGEFSRANLRATVANMLYGTGFQTEKWARGK